MTTRFLAACFCSTVLAIALADSAAAQTKPSAESGETKEASGTAKGWDISGALQGKLLGGMNLQEMGQAAADLRAAAEAFERFGDSLNGTADRVATAIENTSRHHAEMSRDFDPFGYKAAFQTIQRQNEMIEKLYRLELRRLKHERRPDDSAKKRGKKKRKREMTRR
ncbi:MAG: hypothetical protein KDA71_05480 [Planctomycetales bacterium]|nr:hypothetical protein [Planctomycetales bacterium]